MSLGFQLRGALSSATAHDPMTLEALEVWFRNACQPLLPKIDMNDEDGIAVLVVGLHPAAERMRLWLENSGEIVASAQTSSAGPGYHIYLCGLLKRMALEFSIRWTSSDEEGDETGYFESGDESLVYSEMLAWLATVCEVVLEEFDSKGADLAIAMQTNVAYEAYSFLITPMGPRSRQWAEATARDREPGKDFFAWWSPEIDAEHYLGRALCMMWTAVRWRSPLVDAEKELLSEVCENLEAAYQLDNTLDYPWREWNEIIEYLGIEASNPRRSDVEQEVRPLIGYRRNPVRVSLVAGWSIRIPGSFAEAWKDNTWCGWDSGITVWVTAFTSEVDGAKRPADEILSDFDPDSDDIVTKATEKLLAKGSIRWIEDTGEQYWRLRARTAVDGRFCLCTICYADTAQKALSVEIWKSLRA